MQNLNGMARRKRAITASIGNLKRAKQFKEDIEKSVEDDGEIVLWSDVLIEESEEGVDSDTNAENDENTSEDNEGAEEGGGDHSDWWKAEDAQGQMVVRRKYERIASKPHERTLQRRRIGLMWREWETLRLCLRGWQKKARAWLKFRLKFNYRPSRL